MRGIDELSLIISMLIFPFESIASLAKASCSSSRGLDSNVVAAAAVAGSYRHPAGITPQTLEEEVHQTRVRNHQQQQQQRRQRQPQQHCPALTVIDI